MITAMVPCVVEGVSGTVLGVEMILPSLVGMENISSVPMTKLCVEIEHSGRTKVVVHTILGKTKGKATTLCG